MSKARPLQKKKKKYRSIAAGHQPTRRRARVPPRLRAAVGADTPIVVGLLDVGAGGVCADAGEQEGATWRRALGALDDPHLWVEAMEAGAVTEIPLFVVVGNVNQGKSSVVAALSENETIPIDSYPGTTRRSGTYVFKAGDRELFRIVDTPGFQRPRQVLAWLRGRGADRGRAAAGGARLRRRRTQAATSSPTRSSCCGRSSTAPASSTSSTRRATSSRPTRPRWRSCAG